MADIITREEIIKKAEEQFAYVWGYVESSMNDNNITKAYTWAETGRAQLDMMFHILDGEYGNYDFWFNRFCYYDCV